MLLMPAVALERPVTVLQLQAKWYFILMSYREVSVPNEIEEGGTIYFLSDGTKVLYCSF